MEQNQKILTCLMKDDISSFLLTYRKFAALDYDVIGVQTAYDRRDQRFIITQDITCHFPNIACIGPVPVYEDYVTMANFPYDTDLSAYEGNTIHLDIVEHLKQHHIEDVYPKHKTIYHPKLQVDQEIFKTTANSINHNRLNLVINIFDPTYDQDFNFIYDIIFCINALQQEFNLPITLYIAGLVHADYSFRSSRIMKEELALGSLLDIILVNVSGDNLSKQLSYMLHSDLVLSGSYGIGFLSYMIRAPSCIVFPYNMQDLMGKTIDKNRNTSAWYLETTDEHILSNLDQIIKITRRAYDRNRNSNV